MPPPRPRFPLVFSAFCVGPACERGPARPDRRARAGGGADAEDARRRTARWATLVGTVFAHRVFDIVPALLLIGYVLATADIPGWALTSLIAVVSRRRRCSSCSRSSSARRHHRSVLEEAGTLKRVVTHGALRARRDARAAPRDRRDLLPVPRLAVPVLRRLHGDARLRHPRAAAGGGARARPDERGHDLPALARERRAHPGCDRPSARRSTASPTRRASRSGSACRRSKPPSASASASSSWDAKGLSFAMLRKMPEVTEAELPGPENGSRGRARA